MARERTGCYALRHGGSEHVGGQAECMVYDELSSVNQDANLYTKLHDPTLRAMNVAQAHDATWEEAPSA